MLCTIWDPEQIAVHELNMVTLYEAMCKYLWGRANDKEASDINLAEELRITPHGRFIKRLAYLAYADGDGKQLVITEDRFEAIYEEEFGLCNKSDRDHNKQLLKKLGLLKFDGKDLFFKTVQQFW